MHILAIDIGTSSVKAAVLDTETATPVGTIARGKYELRSPTPEASEVDPEVLWQCVMDTARQAVWNTRESDAQIEGVGLSGLTPALVLLDKDDKPIMPIWSHLDRRSRPAARMVWRSVGAPFLRTIGNRPLPGGISAVCVKQMLDTEYHLLHKIRSYLHVNGWVGFRLTGKKVFDPANASFTGLYETLGSRTWSQEWCDFFELDIGWLPEIVSGETTIGSLRSDAAGELGVPPGIPVKIGSADTSMAMLAVGMNANDVMHVVGTTQVLSVFVDNPTPTAYRLTRHFGFGDRMVQVTHNPLGGVSLDWIYSLCFRDQDKNTFFEQTIPKALDIPTKVVLDPPFLGGDRLQIEAHRASFRDMTINTDRMQVLSALLHEMVRRHREALKALGMKKVTGKTFLTGGGSEVIRRIIPEYQTQEIHDFEEGSLMGVAKLFRLPTS